MENFHSWPIDLQYKFLSYLPLKYQLDLSATSKTLSHQIGIQCGALTLLNFVKDLKEKYRKEILWDDITNQNYCLRKACKMGAYSVVVVLLHYFKKDPTSVKYNQCLLYAVKIGHIEIIKQLLLHNIAPNFEDNAPLCSAVESGHLETVKLLINVQADPSARDNYSLTISRQLQHTHITDYLLALNSVTTVTTVTTVTYDGPAQQPDSQEVISPNQNPPDLPDSLLVSEINSSNQSPDVPETTEISQNPSPDVPETTEITSNSPPDSPEITLISNPPDSPEITILSPDPPPDLPKFLPETSNPPPDSPEKTRISSNSPPDSPEITKISSNPPPESPEISSHPPLPDLPEITITAPNPPPNLPEITITSSNPSVPWTPPTSDPRRVSLTSSASSNPPRTSSASVHPPRTVSLRLSSKAYYNNNNNNNLNILDSNPPPLESPKLSPRISPPSDETAFVTITIGSTRTVRDSHTNNKYTEYEIFVKTNIPLLTNGKSTVLLYRRYSQFRRFFQVMEKFITSSNRIYKVLPNIISDDYFARFRRDTIERRIDSFQRLMDAICGDSKLRTLNHTKEFLDPLFEYPKN